MHRTAMRSAALGFPLPYAPTTFCVDRRKDIGDFQSQHNPVYLKPDFRDGLPTPPVEDMGTTYQPPQYSQYPRRPDTYSNSNQGGVPQDSYASAKSGSAIQGRQYSVPHSSLNQLPPPLVSNGRNDVHVSSQPPYRVPSPVQSITSKDYDPVSTVPRSEEKFRSSSNADVISKSLQIPLSINNSGGSLAEFAAQITCLFWFESTETLKRAESVTSTTVVNPLRNEAIPSSGFRKWVVSILTTTQVSPNVIILALLFIYRLKKTNPAVKGRSGSEYRLLTVALMLGNKFLDDNTYTNKTWAEVSGISVTEIHVMEVEFLSNMKYDLLASKEQWQEWQKKLDQFWIFCDKAAKAPLCQISPQTQLQQRLPSPPTSMQASPPSLTSGYPSSNSTSSPYRPHLSSSHYTPPLPSPVHLIPELDHHSSARKRSYDGQAEESATKRVTRPLMAGSTTFMPSYPTMRHDLPRLSVPHLTISTNQPMSSPYNSSAGVAETPPLLPPLNNNGRSAMSSVYSTPQSWPVLTPTNPSNQHGPPSAGGYTTPSRRTSPHSVHDLLSLGSSPISGNFPSHSQGQASPSYYLQQRNSPYKPVRNVTTLLYPPPSATMQGYSANLDQMHYQPLGRRNDFRPGVVPEYSSHGHYQQYPLLPIPQPNFYG